MRNMHGSRTKFASTGRFRCPNLSSVASTHVACALMSLLIVVQGSIAVFVAALLSTGEQILVHQWTGSRLSMTC